MTTEKLLEVLAGQDRLVLTTNQDHWQAEYYRGSPCRGATLREALDALAEQTLYRAEDRLPGLKSDIDNCETLLADVRDTVTTLKAALGRS